MNAPILIFGAGGMVGRELVRLGGLRKESLVALSRAEGDITDEASVTRAVRSCGPRLIVNAAAYTAVDKAESEADAAMAINADGPAILARSAESAGCPLVHISTDYVFDGDKDSPYTENDRVNPMSCYGRSKEAGERRIREEAGRHVILRTAWVYGVYGNNFLKTMMRLARERDELRVVADQFGCPTGARDIAEAVFAVSDKLSSGAAPWGTYHFTGLGETSWHGFASEIVDVQARWTGRRPKVTPITTTDYPTPARRPVNSRLDISLFVETFGHHPMDWKKRTAEVVEELSPPP